MSTSDEPDHDAAPTMECRICRTDVPAGVFCGRCGAHLTAQRGDGPQWLRLAAFAAAPEENVLRPTLASSLFPHLPQRSRAPFRVGLLLILAGLTGFALLKMPAPALTVATFGSLLLFLIYLYESDVYRNVSRKSLVIATLLSLGLGAGWVELSGVIAVRRFSLAFGAGVDPFRLLQDGLAVPISGIILLAVPVVVVRLLRPQSREALDGFVIGALSALAFTGAATAALTAPQFAEGLISHSRPVAGVVVEAAICGVMVPLTGVAAGGLVGLTLWFTRPPDRTGERDRTRLVLLLLTLAAIVIYASGSVIDVLNLQQTLTISIRIAMAIAALIIVRIALQLALLHEAHDQILEHEPLLCVHCGNVVPDMAFCPACGVAIRASSRSSRDERRERRPVRNNESADAA
jgi:rRNA maturation endonuclease Nob1